MDMATVRKIADLAIDLIELCSGYVEKPNITSTPEQWALHDAILEKQREIARMLEEDTFNLTEKSGRPIDLRGWHVFGTHMSGSNAEQIFRAVGSLVYSVAKHKARNPSEIDAFMVKRYQYTIARMLDPDAVRTRNG